MNRRDFGKGLFGALAGALVAAKASGGSKSKPPADAVSRAKFVRELKRYVRQKRRGLPERHLLECEPCFETKGFKIAGMWWLPHTKALPSRAWSVGFVLTSELLHAAASGNAAARKRAHEVIDRAYTTVLLDKYEEATLKPEGCAITYVVVGA